MCSRTGVLFPEFPPMAVVFFGQLLAQAVSFSLDGGQCFLELFVFVFDDTAFFFQTVQFALGSLTLAIKENRCEASKMAYFFVKFFIFFLSNV